MAKPNIPNITFMKYAEGYEEISTNPLDYEGKNVLIMGKYYQRMLQSRDFILCATTHGQILHSSLIFFLSRLLL